MKKIIKKAICFICAILFFQSGSIPTYAYESAAFYVQTAAALSDGMIRVSVYLKDADNLAGIDADIFFDSTKVSFEGSSLGQTFSSAYADINYDKEKSKIHYILLYPDGLSENGIVMTIDFKLKETQAAYQPELKVNDLIDNSDEMNEIPYSIKYQQADGKWNDSADQSGALADKALIADTLKTYGSKADVESKGEPSKDSVGIDSNNNLSGGIDDQNNADNNTPQILENTENMHISDTENDTENIVTGKKDSDSVIYEPNTENINEKTRNKPKKEQEDWCVYAIILVFVVIIIAAARLAKLRKNKH